MNKEFLRECVSNTVSFVYYRKGNLWYKCKNGFLFPVPINDTGDATFSSEDKGLLFMRWIKQHIPLALGEGKGPLQAIDD